MEYRNYSNLVCIILIMQNSADFGKNGVSNLVHKGKIFRCFFAFNLVCFTEKSKNLVRTAGEKRRKKSTNVFGKDTSLFFDFLHNL